MLRTQGKIYIHSNEETSTENIGTFLNKLQASHVRSAAFGDITKNKTKQKFLLKPILKSTLI